MKDIQVIAFDADDTLWVNEPYFQETENKFCELLEDYLPQHNNSQELFKTEMQNLHLYGYGVKSFILSMIETVLRITNGNADSKIISQVIELGKEQLNKPVELLDGVDAVLENLYGKYTLVMATKGDLLDQERKLKKSGLEKYFHHIEIMSDKQIPDYEKLIKHLDCKAENFLMLGNSIKSDTIPVLEIGGYAAHIPYHVTWNHEKVETSINNPKFIQLSTITEILNFLH